MAHPPRIPVRLRWEQGVIYFVTFCVRDRCKVLATNEAFAAFKAALTKLGKWTVIAGLLMPDHVHLLAAPKDRDGQLAISPGVKGLDAPGFASGLGMAGGQL